MSWLIERGCSTRWDDSLVLTTPTSRSIRCATWQQLPYLTKEQIEQVFADLPQASRPGRSGRTAGARVRAASV
eukprot:2214815-Pyramimonas_sp.AAC.1